MEYRNELIEIIAKDEMLIETLTIVKNLKLKDSWVGAGRIRNKVWDVLHGKQNLHFNDIDVVFFDPIDSSQRQEKEMEQKLAEINPKVRWSVKNQARMHLRNAHQPYSNTENAVSYWPETATAVAARLDLNDKIEILAPYGLNDLFHLIVSPTPNFDVLVFQKRVQEKQWEKQWKNLKFTL